MYYGFYHISVNFPDIKIGIFTKQKMQPVACAEQSETIFISGFIKMARIADHYLMIPVLHSGYYSNSASVHLFANTMFYGVFHKGLQHHWRNGLHQGVFRNFIL